MAVGVLIEEVEGVVVFVGEVETGEVSREGPIPDNLPIKK